MRTNPIPPCLAGHTQSIARSLRLLLQRRACLWSLLVVLASLAFGPRPAQAAVTEAWVHRYSNVVNVSFDWAAKVVRDAADDIIVTGTSGADMLTLKYSGADGSVLWQRRSNGLANSGDAAAADDEANATAAAVAVDSSGNVVVTGTSYKSRSQNGTAYFYTAKYGGGDGTLVWERRSNGSANSGNAAAVDDEIRATAAAVAVDGSGNVVMTGTSEGEIYTAKYAAADGALLWDKRSTNGEPRAVAVDGSGNVVVTGSSWNGLDYDYYTAKYAAADGALLWDKRSTNGVVAMSIDSSGNVVVTGSSWNGLDRDYYTAKYAAADGALLWDKRYNGPANRDDYPSAVAVDSSGNVVMTGTSEGDIYTAKYAAADGALLWEKRSTNGVPWAMAVDPAGNVVVAGDKRSAYSTDFFTVKYAATDGALLWEKGYNWPGSYLYEWLSPPIPYSVTVDSRGNVVFTGTSGKASGSNFQGYVNSFNFDYYTAKYAAADGALLWEKRYDGPGHSFSFANAVAVDRIGDVVVTGYSADRDNPGSYTAKYAAVDGTLLWEHRYTGPPGEYRSIQVESLALDGNGNVIMTGYTSNTSVDYYTSKYAATDGSLLWERRYDGPAKLQDIAHAVAVDGSGNVVVTGQSASRATPGSGPVSDIYTAKYASADGALLWEKRYNGPADLEDQGHAVTVDAKGDVIVSGVSATSGSPLVGFVSDGYTAKYASADGALLWEKRVPGAGGVTAAVDSSGNVVVTGSSWNGLGYDYYTAKYAAADGALLWEKRYDGPAKGYDFADAVALDGSGNVVVTGFSATRGSVSSGFSYDYYTAKYAAADGTLLWEKHYDGPAKLDDIAEAVRVDGNGNVVVTGRSASRRLLSGGFINDYYTAKYAAVDGALLWEKRYNGPAKRDDYPSSLALGPNGMVVVTGSSSGTGSSHPWAYAGYDYATVVYREGLPPVAIDLTPTGVRFHFTGIPGRSYNIERAPAVTGPWSTINTQTASASGLIDYLDTNPPVGSAFYRTREP